MKLIDADALRDEINSHGAYRCADQPDWETVEAVLATLNAAPSINCATVRKRAEQAGDAWNNYAAEHWTNPAVEVADAAIAELEADRARKAEAISDLVDRAEQSEAALDSFLGLDGGRTVIELRTALAERDEEMATIQWLAREAIAATWPVRPSDETIESEYQQLLADARRGKQP